MKSDLKPRRRRARIIGTPILLSLAATWPHSASSHITEPCQSADGLCDPSWHANVPTDKGLRLAFILAPQGGPTSQPPMAVAPRPGTRKLNSIREVLDALRSCFAGAVAPDTELGLAATIRFSFTRSGDILGEPRFTYVQSGIPAGMKHNFEQAIGHALIACAPLPFTDSLGGALAGRPFSIRVVKPAKAPIRS